SAIAPLALVNDGVGATRALEPAALGPAATGDAAVPTLEVVCDRKVRASLALLGDGRLLLAALGGYLGMEPVRSSRVEEAQRLLAKLGYDPGSSDGVFGDKTAAAIESFQAASGMAVTGGLDDALLDRLRAQAPPPQ